MFGAGLASALLAIGSGMPKVPAMESALRLPIKVSSATSSLMIGVTAAASAGACFILGDVVSSVAEPIVLGSVIGSMLARESCSLLSMTESVCFSAPSACCWPRK
jgi:uncharacterized protein